jgi:hypothetical protein
VDVVGEQPVWSCSSRARIWRTCYWYAEWTKRGDVVTDGAGSRARAHRPTAVDGKRFTRRIERGRRVGRSLCGNSDAFGACLSRCAGSSDRCEPIDARSGFRLWISFANRNSVWRSARVDCFQSRASRCIADWRADQGSDASLLQRGLVVLRAALSLVLLMNEGATFVRANAEYFDSVGTHVVMGRGISQKDTATAPAVAVVNRAFVKKFLNGANPIGQHFGTGPDSTGDFEIVGVVEDTVYTSVRWKDHRMFFVPMMQQPSSAKNYPIETNLSLYAGALVLETKMPVKQMEALTQRTLASINPNLTIVKFQTFDEQIADRFTKERMVARLTELFGVLALLLATVGLYGVTAYAAARRTGEIGIRMALGAGRAGVIAMVMRGAMIQAGLGLAVGIPAALLCVRFVESQLYEVKGIDADVLITSILALALTACVAGLIPARRAASIDPAHALRSE